MKILFLAHPYFDLHKPILNEMVNQGHEVYMILDKPLDFDPNYRSVTGFKKQIKKIIRRFFQIEKRYWKRLIHSDKRLSEKYDFLFCIQGLSFSPTLYEHLKKLNPGIKSVLYAWDTDRYYDFFRYSSCFDRCYSFDMSDASRIANVELLPSYWVPREVENPQKYFISLIGSDHDDRLEIASKVVSQLNAKNKSYYIKIVLNKLTVNKYLHPKKYEQLKNELQKKDELSYTTKERIPVEEVVNIVNSSTCILDTDMPIQTGATERVIWALAQGKKVISTNSSLKQMPFFDENQIQIIDRKNPVIDFSFLEKETDYNRAFFDQLRIDNWVNIILK